MSCPLEEKFAMVHKSVMQFVESPMSPLQEYDLWRLLGDLGAGSPPSFAGQSCTLVTRRSQGAWIVWCPLWAGDILVGALWFW